MTTISSQSITISALELLFASRSRATILRLFMLDPQRAYYQRQIESATGLPIRAVQRELERLSELNLLYRRDEGNRTYYQVDTHFPLFPELRNMVLKTVEPLDRLRGLAAADDSVRLAFVLQDASRALLVTANGRRPRFAAPSPFEIEAITEEAFLQALSERAESITPFLTQGTDLLGRREDVLWRRIEAAGYHVPKAEGVA